MIVTVGVMVLLIAAMQKVKKEKDNAEKLKKVDDKESGSDFFIFRWW